MTQPHLVIADPGLNGHGGHHASYARLLLDAAHAKGWSAQLFCHKEAPDVLVNELSATPWFPVSHYVKASSDPLCAHLENFLQVNSLLTAPYTQLPVSWNSSTILLAHSTTPNNAIALQHLLNSIPLDRRPKTVIEFAPPFGPIEPQMAFYRYVMKRLSVPELRVSWIDDAPRLASVLGQIYPVQFKRVPLVLHQNADAVNLPESLKQFLAIQPNLKTITYLGTSAWYKGFDLLPDVIAEALYDKFPCRFVIQAQSLENAERLLELEAAAPAGTLFLIKECLEADEYAAVLNASDIVLLPYDPDFYQLTNSCVFTEALVAGKVVIFPKGTSMEDDLKEWGAGGVAIDSFSPSATISAIDQALEQWIPLHELSLAAAESCKNFHHPGRYLDLIAE